MIKYKLKFRNDRGEVFEENSAHETRVEAVRSIQARGLHPISVKREFRVDTSNIILSKKVSKNKTADFLELMGDTLSSGISLTSATEELLKTEKSGYMSVIVKSVDDQLRQGIPLSDALEKFPTVFLESDIYLIRSGEATGDTDEVLLRLSDNHRKSGEFSKALIGSLIYPAIIMLMSVLVVYVLVVYLVPTVSDMYDQMDGELPAITLMVVALSEQLTENILYFVFGAAGIIGGIVYLLKNKIIRYQIDKWLLKVPFFGMLVRTYEAYKISYVISSLLEGGVATNKTLEIVTRVVKNRYIAREMEGVRNAVETNGVTLSEAFGNTTHVLPVFMQNVRAGEATGEITTKLERLSERLERNLNKSLNVIKSTISPVLIAILAVFIGILMYAVMSPVYSIMDYM